MTAGTRVIVQPTLRRRGAAAALAAMFGIGVLTGLAVTLVPLPALVQVSTPAASTQASFDAAALRTFQAHRAGERGDIPTLSTVGDPIWVTYRAGERGDTTP